MCIFNTSVFFVCVCAVCPMIENVDGNFLFVYIFYMWHVMGHTHRCMSSEDAHVAKEIEIEFAFKQTHQHKLTHKFFVIGSCASMDN